MVLKQWPFEFIFTFVFSSFPLSLQERRDGRTVDLQIYLAGVLGIGVRGNYICPTGIHQWRTAVWEPERANLYTMPSSQTATLTQYLEPHMQSIV
jgi:hypothetical protein